MPVNPDSVGSSFDDFLREEGILEDVEALAMKRTIAYRVEDEMKRQGYTTGTLAKAMGTSRAAVGRLIDPNLTALTVKSMATAFRVLGLKLEITGPSPKPAVSARKGKPKAEVHKIAADSPVKKPRSTG